ncbi:farnesyl-pyrophosphate synthetase [Anaeramoeba ignava]|uniref:Farnesyl-pyrophosphate synthetase n=1 Tax=Anaeramoeba ignava TaxID=1746090 RepID=A0A9Q0LAJ6_ANAIG|nr:farnesyl-pyrophosphate synthetase [Anaeramoeba ignava]
MSENYRELLLNEFPKIVEEIINSMKTKIPKLALDHLKKNIEYNVPHGKLTRGITVIETFKSFLNDADSEKLKKAIILGWTVEFLQGFFLVADDIMDKSLMRRGQTCWYKLESIGEIAINDSFILENILYKLLKTHFKNDKIYLELMNIFHKISWKTEMGQMLDLLSTPPNTTPNFETFTKEYHEQIVNLKTAYYSFYLPVALGVILASNYREDLNTKQLLKEAKPILLEMGKYFQIQDDYLDCYGDPQILGKIGTDIQDGKCSWLIVQALEIADENQKQLLYKNYSHDSPKSISIIKKIYQELDLDSKFHTYENVAFENLEKLIESLKIFPKEILRNFLLKIFKRKK